MYTDTRSVMPSCASESDVRNASTLTDAVYLATDPDREGEAISWHVYEVLKERNVLDSKAVHRVVFHEVTKRAIQEAIGNRASSRRSS